MTPKIMIATIWKENKARRRRKKEDLLGALRREDDLRLGDENAQQGGKGCVLDRVKI